MCEQKTMAGVTFHRLLHLVLCHVHELNDEVTLVQQEIMLHRSTHTTHDQLHRHQEHYRVDMSRD